MSGLWEAWVSVVVLTVFSWASREAPQHDDRDPRLERIRRNEESFREANSRIEDKAREVGLAPPLPMLCECFDPNCVGLIQVEPSAYERVRLNADRFFVIPGHQVEGEQVVEESAAYLVVDKTNEGG